MIDEVLKRVLL